MVNKKSHRRTNDLVSPVPPFFVPGVLYNNIHPRLVQGLMMSQIRLKIFMIHVKFIETYLS